MRNIDKKDLLKLVFPRQSIVDIITIIRSSFAYFAGDSINSISLCAFVLMPSIPA
jgi:hypothetical protein